MIIELTHTEREILVDVLVMRMSGIYFDHYASDQEEIRNQATLVLLRGLIKKLSPSGGAI